MCKFISYAKDHKNDSNAIEARNYWPGTENTGTEAIKSYVGYLGEKDNQKLQDLSDGKDITITVNDSMNYDSLNLHKVNDMWSLLLHTGYLTAVKSMGHGDYKVKIPNPEIKDCFNKSIQASFMDALTAGNKNNDILRALSDGDNLKARELIGSLLVPYISLRVYANKSRPANFL